jgi:acyl-CoA thioester hydrolase
MSDFKFSIPITVRIGDINYGNHVGYQIYLLYFQEARIAYLKNMGYSERDVAGYGMIVSSVECKYKKELLLGEEFRVECRISELKSKALTMEYRVVKGETLHALGSTSNLCFDRQARKVGRWPQVFVDAVQTYEGIAADAS